MYFGFRSGRERVQVSDDKKRFVLVLKFDAVGNEPT